MSAIYNSPYKGGEEGNNKSALGLTILCQWDREGIHWSGVKSRDKLKFWPLSSTLGRALSSPSLGLPATGGEKTLCPQISH